MMLSRCLTPTAPRMMLMRASMRHRHLAVSSMSSRDKSSMSFVGYQENNEEKQKLDIPDFNDAQASFETKSTYNLLRATLVYTLCGIPPLVNNAEPLLR